MQKVVMTIGIGGVILGIFFIIGLKILGKGLSLTTQVKEFYVCRGSDPTTGEPLEALTSISASDIDVYACGYVETDGRPTLLEVFTLDSRNNLINRTPINHNQFGPGYFYYPLNSNRRLSAGKYDIYLYHGRMLISTVEITVTR